MAAVALAASACACSTKDDPAPVIRTVTIERQIPAEARKPCADPVILPDRRLSETETTNLWGRDRTALRVCETRRVAGVSTGGPQ